MIFSISAVVRFDDERQARVDSRGGIEVDVGIIVETRTGRDLEPALGNDVSQGRNRRRR